ncbi:MAG: AtpZ/AtpI family protein [Sedimentisphaerales bacterium]|nr:AtpZ/AtpI family protein [Sedimentisphaerales bacterium]
MSKDEKSTDSNEEGSKPEDMEQNSFQWLGVGVEFCIVVVACMLFGHWLDTKADTSPGFLILFFLFGFGGMLYSMIKRAGGLKWWK